MSKRVFWPFAVAILLCAILPVRGQGQGRGNTGQGGGIVQGDDAPVARVAGEVEKLPAGPGKDIVGAACAQCHALQQLDRGHDAGQWQLTVERMLAAGAKVPPAQVDTVVAYLAKNFPEKPLPPAVIVPGNANVVFREWTSPTKGSRPHDPLCCGGRLALVLGDVREHAGSRRYENRRDQGIQPQDGGVGTAWPRRRQGWQHLVHGELQGLYRQAQSENGRYDRYKLPPSTRDPHTPMFDPKGILWFTAQNSNIVGRLDPKTGEVKVVSPPTPKSNPYGMVMDSKGTPWFCQFNVNKLASIDPATMEIKEYTLPNPESRPRRIAITSDDVIWYADYSRGYLGRFETKTGKVTEYASPGGPKSQPYGITAANDIVWYSEANTKPNTLVRFDPKTEKFQTWAIPSGGGVVRNMMTTKEGNLVLAESGVNKVALVEILK